MGQGSGLPAGLVEAERYRYWTCYRLRPEALRTLAGHLHALAGTAPTGTACRRAVDAATQPPRRRPAPPRRQPHAVARPAHGPITRATFAHAIEDLAGDFRGIFSLETVERYVNESIDRLQGARVVDFMRPHHPPYR